MAVPLAQLVIKTRAANAERLDAMPTTIAPGAGSVTLGGALPPLLAPHSLTEPSACLAYESRERSYLSIERAAERPAFEAARRYRAAKACHVDAMLTTGLLGLVTLDGAAPPSLELPHALTLPSSCVAAKADLVDTTLTTRELGLVTVDGADSP